mmetsp:Transcript_4394/g.6957  ORF Transcript_4394/g.6957 Transcript_4394/m.6957 type:complete len:299 (+) Transcript_4394:224-1120(+)
MKNRHSQFPPLCLIRFLINPTEQKKHPIRRKQTSSRHQPFADAKPLYGTVNCFPQYPEQFSDSDHKKSLLSAHTSSLVAVPVPILVLRCLQTPSQCVTPVQTGRRGSETQTFQMLARKTAFLRIHDLILVAQKCWMSCPELFVFFAEALTKKLHRCHDLRSRQELLPSLTSLWSTLSVKPHCTTECNGLRNSMCSALTKLVPVMDVGTSVLVLKGLQETVHHFSTADSANQTLETSIALGLIGAVKERTRDSSKRPFFPKHQRSSVLSVRDRRWGKWRIWRMCRRIVHLLQTTSNQTS